MSDPTTRRATAARSQPPALRPKTVALAGVAVMTLILAALAFTLSFDALRALAIDIGVRPQRAWMAPVAIDIAQAAATAGLVVIGVADKYKAARWYCMGLATLTVLLSVAGNSYHAYGLAQQNLARVGAGQDLGFTPQPPIVAACIAAIFPLLWLALLHLFTIMLRVIVDERTAAATSANMQEPAMMQRASAPERTTTPSTGRNDAAGAGTDPVDVAHDDASAEHHDTEPATVDASASQHDVAADVPVAIDTPATSHVDVIEDDLVTTAAPRATIPDIDGAPMQDLDPAPAVTRTGYPQTHAGLLDFLVDVDLSDQVKEVARILITQQHRNQADVAREFHVDKSTISRRWTPFVAAAKAEGFTVPPLPRPILAEARTQQIRELQPA
ncbi:hypothetical protein MWT96_25105 (plasmid) [Prescottella equi]|nr:DUF2637 domain-containing protein [Prescottella equi]AVR64934.1 putative mebrane protein [Prescottella equi]MCU7531810.1 hypothetical protein [Prescottella equi]MCU7537227.1 hypothetical protein [Prescottella equi]UPH39146.1 hypothetical protein GS533_025390 [Prescottella equi]UPH39169.1 hypothetical protein GS533_024975 [Prescottella equi]